MTDFHKNKADELAKIDPLLMAEELTGESYKDDKATSALGMLFMMEQQDQLRMMRQESMDTFRGCSADYMMGVLDELGATMVYTENIVSDRTEHNEIFQVWEHPEEHWIVVFDTFTSSSKNKLNVNRADLYFNIVLDNIKNNWREYAEGYSGTVNVDNDSHEDVLCASFDALDGLKSTVESLRLIPGRFAEKWTEGFFFGLCNRDEIKQFYCLSHFGDKSSYEEGASGSLVQKREWPDENSVRYKQLPENIRRNLAADNAMPLSLLHTIGK